MMIFSVTMLHYDSKCCINTVIAAIMQQAINSGAIRRHCGVAVKAYARW